MIENLQIFILLNFIQLSKMEVSYLWPQKTRFMLPGEVLGNVVVSRKFLKQFIFVCPPFPPKNPHRLMELVTVRRKTVGRRGATFNLELWRSQPSYLLLTQNSYLLELKT